MWCRCVSLIALLLLCGCTRGGEVVVGLDVAEQWAGPALREFTARDETRIDTRRGAPAYATAPIDLWWVRDLEPLFGAAARGEIPPLAAAATYGRVASMVGAAHHWIGLSAVARVLVYDPARIADDAAPTRLVQLAQPGLARQLVLADPARGLATWTAAALVDRLGEARTLALYRAVLSGGARVVDDEEAVLAALTDGSAALALTDSDVAFVAQERQPTLVITVPDQDDGGLGALLLPVAVALTQHGAGNAAARRLFDELLSPPATLRLTLTGNHVLVLHESNAPAGMLRADDLRVMAVDYRALAERLPSLRPALARLRQPT